MEEEAEKLKEMQGEVEKQMMSAKSGVCVYLILGECRWAKYRERMKLLSVSEVTIVV